MSRQSELQKLAGDILEHLQARRHDAQKGLAEIKTRQAEHEAVLETTKLAFDRFRSFQPEINGDVQCPHCWVVNGVEQGLKAIGRPVESDTTHIDYFRCSRCGNHFELMD